MGKAMTVYAATKAGGAAIEKRRVRAYVPAWPWVPIGFAIRHLPLSVVRKMT